jgi:hypothetical protein
VVSSSTATEAVDDNEDDDDGRVALACAKSRAVPCTEVSCHKRWKYTRGSTKRSIHQLKERQLLAPRPEQHTSRRGTLSPPKSDP